MCASIILLIPLLVCQVVAGGFEWKLRPSVQYACVGSDKVLHWKYNTETSVSIVLLQNLRTTLTLVECESTAKDVCFVYSGFRDKVKVVEMVQGSAKYYFSNLTTSDNAVYMLQLFGPGISDNATLFVFSDDDLAADYFVNNEQVKANSSYICTEKCDSVPILVKTHDHLQANISFFNGNDENELLLVCSNRATCAYAHKQGSSTARIKIEVNYGFCNKVTSYLDISISGDGLSNAGVIAVTVVSMVLLLAIVIVFVFLYKLKKLSYIRRSLRTSSSKASSKYLMQGDHCSNIQSKDPEGAVPAAVSPKTCHHNRNSQEANEKCDYGMKNEDPVKDSLCYLQNNSTDSISDITECLGNMKLQSPTTKVMPSQKEETKPNFIEYRDPKNVSDSSEDEQDTDNRLLHNSDTDEDVLMRDDPQKASISSNKIC